MTVSITDNMNGTWTLTPDAEALSVIQWALANHSKAILQEVLDGWLRSESGHMRASVGQQALSLVAPIPQASLDKAVDGIMELTTDQRNTLKNALKNLKL